MTRLPSERNADRRRLLLIPLAAFVIVHPMIVHGCSCGHDFDFHLTNWMEAASQFIHGNLHPHWAYSPAFNAGEPRFVFYPPLSWVLGAFLGVLLTHVPGVTQASGWNAAPIVFTWVALILSGVTCYQLTRAFANTNAALLAAILYLANPYMLFTAYERTAYAELLAAAWIPLLLLAILRHEVTIPRIALPVALLWLTNAPAAVMGSYTLAAVAIVRVIATDLNTTHLASETWVSRHRSSLTLAWTTLSGTALGLALAAFYMIPAAYERRFVQIAMATAGGMRIDQNFLFEHTGTSPDALLHDQVLRTASLIAVILCGVTVTALVVVFVRRKQQDSQIQGSRTNRFPALLLALLTVAIAILLTPVSTPIWNHIPEMAFLQFPWRLLAILATIGALAIAAAFSRLTWNTTTTGVVALAIAAGLSIAAYHLFQQHCYVEDTAPAQLALFQSHTGTDPTDEYTPLTADNDALKPNAPPYWLSTDPNSEVPSAVRPGTGAQHLTVNAPLPEFLILNLRQYPAWHIYRNGVLEPEREKRDDGLIALPIPSGRSTLDIRYARMPDEWIGDAISWASLLVLLSLLVPCRATARFAGREI